MTLEKRWKFSHGAESDVNVVKVAVPGQIGIGGASLKHTPLPPRHIVHFRKCRGLSVNVSTPSVLYYIWPYIQYQISYRAFMPKCKAFSNCAVHACRLFPCFKFMRVSISVTDFGYSCFKVDGLILAFNGFADVLIFFNHNCNGFPFCLMTWDFDKTVKSANLPHKDGLNLGSSILLTRAL